MDGQGRARDSGFGKHGEILKWLKEQHGIGHGYANYIAKAALAADGGDEGTLVAAQYAGWLKQAYSEA
jgi:hypothetical protein